MFIAMNRFKVIRDSEAAFEQVWLSRDSHLEKGARLRGVSPSQRPRS
jgi:heme-degrading monooxygenase HmoA